MVTLTMSGENEPELDFSSHLCTEQLSSPGPSAPALQGLHGHKQGNVGANQPASMGQTGCRQTGHALTAVTPPRFLGETLLLLKAVRQQATPPAPAPKAPRAERLWRAGHSRGCVGTAIWTEGTETDHGNQEAKSSGRNRSGVLEPGKRQNCVKLCFPFIIFLIPKRNSIPINPQ